MKICQVTINKGTFPSVQRTSTGQIHRVKGSKGIPSPATIRKSPNSNIKSWCPGFRGRGMSEGNQKNKDNDNNHQNTKSSFKSKILAGHYIYRLINTKIKILFRHIGRI
jgi:hypothetical protein